MYERNLGVQNMHQIEIAYLSENKVESNIHKLNRIKRERKHPQKYLA